MPLLGKGLCFSKWKQIKKHKTNQVHHSEFWQLNLIENWMLSISLRSLDGLLAMTHGCCESFYRLDWFLSLVLYLIISLLILPWWSILFLSLQLVPPWLEVRVMQACQSQCSLCSSVFVSSLFAPFFFGFLNRLHFPSSLFCHTHRAIIGIHASTASICEHDHVRAKGTLRSHGVCSGWTRGHRRSEWWRGGMQECLSLFVSL